MLSTELTPEKKKNNNNNNCPEKGPAEVILPATTREV